jgi:hypothetical protein
MTLFLRLITALEIFLVLKKLREQYEASNSNTPSHPINQNPLQKERQGTDAEYVEIGQSK